VAFGWNDCWEAPTPDSQRKLNADRRMVEFGGSAKNLLHRSRFYRTCRKLMFSREDEQRRRAPLDEYRENLIAMSDYAPRTIYLTLPQAPCDDEQCRRITSCGRHEHYNAVIRTLGEYGDVVDADREFINCGNRCLLDGFPVIVADGRVTGGDPIHPNPWGARLIAGLVAEAIDAHVVARNSKPKN